MFGVIAVVLLLPTVPVVYAAAADRQAGEVLLAAALLAVVLGCAGIFVRLWRPIVTVTPTEVVLDREFGMFGAGRAERVAVPLGDIARVESRAEYYTIFRSVVIARGYALVLRDGRQVEIGADNLARAVSGGRYFEQLYQKAASEIARRLGRPIVASDTAVEREPRVGKRTWEARPLSDAMRRKVARARRHDLVWAAISVALTFLGIAYAVVNFVLLAVRR
jgi:hypothetical protein